MSNPWIESLKEYNSSKGQWCVPRKGTPAYNEVVKIMDSKKAYSPVKPVRRKKKTKEVSPDITPVKPVRRKKKKTKGVDLDVIMNMMDLTENERKMFNKAVEVIDKVTEGDVSKAETTIRNLINKQEFPHEMKGLLYNQIKEGNKNIEIN